LYAVLITSCKLHHYFEYYKIAMVTEFPLGDILRNKEASGHIIKRAVKLGSYSIEFRCLLTPLTPPKLGCHPQHGARGASINKCKCSSRINMKFASTQIILM
jgi:hypothetical protein